MKDEGGRMKRREATSRGRVLQFALGIVIVSFVSNSCALKAGRGGVPAEVEAVVATVSEDIAAERYEKIYNEADEEWRHDATLEKTTEIFTTLKGKLGQTRSRQLHTASEENRSNGRLGHSFVLTYETTFERGEGMETFTLVERKGHWLLAKYLVNSTSLN
jgi:Protein of unknown function (DUF4019)